MRRMHLTLLERERDEEASMAQLADAMCGGRHDSCYRKHKHARASHGMGPESLSRGVDLFFAGILILETGTGPPSGPEQAKTYVLLTTVLGPLRRGSPSSAPPAPHQMLHERRFFLLTSQAIVLALSCVYGQSLFTGYLTNVINPTSGTARGSKVST